MRKFVAFIKAFKNTLVESHRAQTKSKSPPHSLSKEKIGFVLEKPPVSSPQPIAPIRKEEEKFSPVVSIEERLRDPVGRDPYFIQIGFDFGTSFSKCICRDVIIDKAWVFIPEGYGDKELPFLIPSALKIDNGSIHLTTEPDRHYLENGVYYLKLALKEIALGQWENPILKPYRDIIGGSDNKTLQDFVEGCGVYFLANTFGQVRRQIYLKFNEFGSNEKDYIAVNMAVPVADAQLPTVDRIFRKILNQAWSLADELLGYNRIAIDELNALLYKKPVQIKPYLKDSCFIYPEVSANVQGFVRSRVSSPGMYLFSDTGAGSVDQSIFIFSRNDVEHLTYLYGSVWALGSSLIERLAAEHCGNVDCHTLESWREKKENDGSDLELRNARDNIAKELAGKTQTTLAWAKRKLFVREQIENIRIIFGGGGHCDHPYKSGVLVPFSGQLFYRIIHPPIVGLPVPIDLQLKPDEERWMSRLSVAYGLSFVKDQLVGFTYPKDVDFPEPEQIWRQQRHIPDAPTMDEI
jgi:hypothetical protein